MIIARQNKKSQKLTPAELLALKRLYKRCDPKDAIKDTLDISRQAVENIILRGSASPATVTKIRTALSLTA